MKAHGKFTIVIRGSTEQTGKVPFSSWSGFHYLIQRLLTGDDVAESEFPHYGVDLQLRSGTGGDPWSHGSSAPCVHDWIEVTTKNDRRRRWICANCDAELMKDR